MPVVYVLATNEKQETYEEILNVLLRCEADINPTDSMVDFEMAAINAIKKNFPLFRRCMDVFFNSRKTYGNMFKKLGFKFKQCTTWTRTLL